MVIKNLNYEERKKWYIKTYSELAIQQMKKYKIPASIILAQGMVESASGSSNLALKSNNHFGILGFFAIIDKKHKQCS